MKAILILGAAVWIDGPSPTLRRRTAHAAQLWHTQPECVVVPCGGLGRHGPSEAAVMRDILVAEDVSPTSIHLEDRSTNTLDNIRFALPILRALQVTEVTIVTDKTHAPRAALVARHFRLKAHVSSPALRRAHTKTHVRQALREAAAIPVYAARLLRMTRP